MQIKTGDLVQIRVHSHTNELHNPQEIWLVLGIETRKKSHYKGFIRIQNIHNGHIVQYNEGMLMKIKTDKK